MTRQLPFPQPDPTAPPPGYAELRATCPVAKVTTAEGMPAWLVTSYDAAAAVLSDARFGMAPAGMDSTGNDTLFQDGATHTRLRRLVTKAFTPRAIEALRPLIEERAAELVDAMIARGRTADLVEDLATPLSIAVISELLGVTLADRALFQELADRVNAGDGTAWHEFGAYSAKLIAAKRDEPGEDLLSRLIEVRDDDNGRLDDNELIGMVATLVLAGYQTARNAICVAAIQLIEEGPRPLDEVIDRLGGIIGNPMPRWAHEDVEIAGTLIAKGDQVHVKLEAANQDPNRKALPHMSFGRGAHHCLGASLARVEIDAALRTLAAKLPGLRLATPVTEIPWSALSATDRGPESVPVTW
ncbi:cytochrome P450 [Allokutzneria sp. A3M-2-11 16]|uniref:cytochrome P450 n=1 Tax=Allokutzneria sp. A3M-2-11 16 TaxID=2962043 RepID=UPI0020B8C8E3|nr:cytochrome P450 [Allokutzneria sp. A3M-2-11 16]MCP3802801.1 cytochrome P450 [Allokutzneria sp. A3M-2-11 16]